MSHQHPEEAAPGDAAPTRRPQPAASRSDYTGDPDPARVPTVTDDEVRVRMRPLISRSGKTQGELSSARRAARLQTHRRTDRPGQDAVEAPLKPGVKRRSGRPYPVRDPCNAGRSPHFASPMSVRGLHAGSRPADVGNPRGEGEPAARPPRARRVSEIALSPIREPRTGPIPCAG